MRRYNLDARQGGNTAYRVLKDINPEPSYARLAVRREIHLRNLVPAREALPDVLRAFVSTTARIDFVVVNRLTR